MARRLWTRLRGAGRRGLSALLLALAGAAVFAAGGAGARERFDIDVFARVPPPGKPEGIAVASDGTVFVGSSTKGGPNGPRSRVWAYSPQGDLVRDYVIQGQDRSDPQYGLYGMAFDGEDFLYIADYAPPRLIKLSPRTGRHRDYSRLRDVPTCAAAGRETNCSKTNGDFAPFPNFPVFDRAGRLYVTDAGQGLIWRVPRRGGKPRVWFTHPGLEAPFTPNGLGFMRDGRTLLFVQNNSSSQQPAGLYKLRVRDDGSPGTPKLFWQSGSGDGPDGFAVARSGNVYVALAGPTGDAIAVISPGGELLARFPASQIQNQQMPMPFDRPANVAFLGRRALVTNHAFVFQNPARYAVLDVFAGERGLPLFRP